MTTLLPQDSDNNPIPALRLKDDAAHAVSVSGTTARNTAGFDAETRVISLYATVPIYIKFGGSSVTAANTNHYFPEGVYYDFAIGGDRAGHYTHLAALAADTNGSIYISEKE